MEIWDKEQDDSEAIPCVASEGSPGQAGPDRPQGDGRRGDSGPAPSLQEQTDQDQE